MDHETSPPSQNAEGHRELDPIERTRAEFLRRYPPVPQLEMPAPVARRPDGQEIAVLHNLHTQPFVNVDARSVLLHMSVSMIRRTIAGLEAKQMIYPVRFSRKTRGFIDYYNFTDCGLARARLSNLKEGTGSFLHRACQRHIAEHFKVAGIECRVEYLLKGKRADIGYASEGRWVGIEVGLSSADNEARNARKAHEAGFHELLLLARDSSMLNRIEELVGDAVPGLRVDLITEYIGRVGREEEDRHE